MQMFIRNDEECAFSAWKKKQIHLKWCIPFIPDGPMLHAFIVAIWAWAFLRYFQESGSSTSTDPCCGTHLFNSQHDHSHSRMHSPDSLNLEIYDMIKVSVTLFTDLCPSPSSPAHGQLPVPAPVPGCGGFGDGLCLSQLIFWLSRLMILLWNFELFYSYPNEPCHRFCCQVWQIPVLPRK